MCSVSVENRRAFVDNTRPYGVLLDTNDVLTLSANVGNETLFQACMV